MQGQEEAQKAKIAIALLNRLVPEDHPLRKVKALFEDACKRIAPACDQRYEKTGNPGVLPAVLIRAWLLMALYSIESERALWEQNERNAGFCVVCEAGLGREGLSPFRPFEESRKAPCRR
jgi:transposase